MRLNAIGLWLLLLLSTNLLMGCLPSTTATIKLEGSYTETDMSRVENIVEKLGYPRSWYESNKGERYFRYYHDGEITSGFETKIGTPDSGFGIAVVLNTNNGVLQVIFGERNTQFSARGIERKDALVNELRTLYGDKVYVDP